VEINFADLPNQAGVYLFKDDKGNVLYIGKAVNLRARVRSYWHENSWKDRPKLSVLVPQIADLETIITANEKEALILEASLIYKYQPKYNVLLKDNKSFPWIGITYGEDYPRLIPVRDLKWSKRKFPQAKLFGPYTDRGSMYQTLKTAQAIFPLRKRAKPLFRDRPCLNYHLGHCLGPCQGLIGESEYVVLLRQVELFLKGKHEELIAELGEKMQKASEQMFFEQAARYRDQIKILQKSLENQRIITDDPDCERDLIGYAYDSTDLVVQIFKMRSGKLVGREAYQLSLNELQNLPESLLAALKQAYLLRQTDDIPAEILLQNDLELETVNIEGQTFTAHLKVLLEPLKGIKVNFHFPQRGEKKEQIELAAYNAQQQLQANQKQRAKSLIALELLQEALNLPFMPFKIDCFDISHLAGTEVVASCVRFENGQADKSHYRKIKLSIDQNDDFFSMQEAVRRRYQKKGDFPDLILIDGGKGQLGAAAKALTELELDYAETALISLAKKEEAVFTLSKQKILMPKNSPALQLLQRARDEAHRFAVTYNQQRRGKSQKQSLLDSIPGLGVNTKEKLKQHFTLKQLRNTSPQEIAQKLKTNSRRADRIWQVLQNNLGES
jgi:excinuclease ABC subunit C